MMERLKSKAAVYFLATVLLQVLTKIVGPKFGIVIDADLYWYAIDSISLILFGFYVHNTGDKSLL